MSIKSLECPSSTSDCPDLKEKFSTCHGNTRQWVFPAFKDHLGNKIKSDTEQQKSALGTKKFATIITSTMGRFALSTFKNPNFIVKNEVSYVQNRNNTANKSHISYQLCQCHIQSFYTIDLSSKCHLM